MSSKESGKKLQWLKTNLDMWGTIAPPDSTRFATDVQSNVYFDLGAPDRCVRNIYVRNLLDCNGDPYVVSAAAGATSFSGLTDTSGIFTSGQLSRWDGTYWVPYTETGSGEILTAGSGLYKLSTTMGFDVLWGDDRYALSGAIGAPSVPFSGIQVGQTPGSTFDGVTNIQFQGMAVFDDGGGQVRVSGTGAGGGGVTDHGALANLGDNDHPQYLTTADASGIYAISGNYELSGTMVAHLADTGDPHGQYLTHTSGDLTYQPIGNYALSGDSWLKAESDTLYQAAGNYEESGTMVTHNTQWDHDTFITSSGNWEISGSVDAHLSAIDHTAFITSSGNWEISGTVEAHAAASDPHPIYLTQTEGDGLYSVLGHNHNSSYEQSGTMDTHLSDTGDPHPQYLTHVSGDQSYQPIGNYALSGDSYYKAEAESRYVNVTGDTMTGDLTVQGSIGNTVIDGDAGNTISFTRPGPNYISATQPNGTIVFTTDGQTPGTDYRLFIADYGVNVSGELKYNGTDIDDLYVNAAGDTMTGDLVMDEDANITITSDLNVSGTTNLRGTVKLWTGYALVDINNHFERSGLLADHLSPLADDHSFYSREDGTRAFTGKVHGVYPTLSTHLATKSYADAISLGASGVWKTSVAGQVSNPAGPTGDYGIGAGHSSGLVADLRGATYAATDNIPYANAANGYDGDVSTGSDNATFAIGGAYRVGATPTVDNQAQIIVSGFGTDAWEDAELRVTYGISGSYSGSAQKIYYNTGVGGWQLFASGVIWDAGTFGSYYSPTASGPVTTDDSENTWDGIPNESVLGYTFDLWAYDGDMGTGAIASASYTTVAGAEVWSESDTDDRRILIVSGLPSVTLALATIRVSGYTEVTGGNESWSKGAHEVYYSADDGVTYNLFSYNTETGGFTDTVVVSDLDLSQLKIKVECRAYRPSGPLFYPGTTSRGSSIYEIDVQEYYASGIGQTSVSGNIGGADLNDFQIKAETYATSDYAPHYASGYLFGVDIREYTEEITDPGVTTVYPEASGYNVLIGAEGDATYPLEVRPGITSSGAFISPRLEVGLGLQTIDSNHGLIINPTFGHISNYPGPQAGNDYTQSPLLSRSYTLDISGTFTGWTVNRGFQYDLVDRNTYAAGATAERIATIHTDWTVTNDVSSNEDVPLRLLSNGILQNISSFGTGNYLHTRSQGAAISGILWQWDSQVAFNKGMRLTSRDNIVTADTIITPQDNLIVMSGTTTLSGVLPSASSAGAGHGLMLNIRNGGANLVTIWAIDGEVIEGSVLDTPNIATQSKSIDGYNSLQIMAANDKWWVI